MEQYKQEFIEFMVESEVLKFGDFTLKSGRKSPFFMNAGAYVTGEQLHRLGLYYARAIHDLSLIHILQRRYGRAFSAEPQETFDAILEGFQALSAFSGKLVR